MRTIGMSVGLQTINMVYHDIHSDPVTWKWTIAHGRRLCFKTVGVPLRDAFAGGSTAIFWQNRTQRLCWSHLYNYKKDQKSNKDDITAGDSPGKKLTNTTSLVVIPPASRSPSATLRSVSPAPSATWATQQAPSANGDTQSYAAGFLEGADGLGRARAR